jgi:hypothetical protein
MRTRIPLPPEPDHKFDGVARSIAKGTPPEWLVVGLTQFSGGIGKDTSDIDIHPIIEQMQYASHVLITWLPIFNGFAMSGFPYPEEVAVALQVLPKIKKHLDRVAPLKNRKGRPLDAQRIHCAAVVARAWKIIHGRASKSRQVQEACDEYWRACGGKPIGGRSGWDEPENWRRPIDRALTADHALIEKLLLAVQNAH